MGTFTDLWLLNENEAKRLAGRIIDGDQVIHEQQLGLEWEEPPTDLYILN